MTRLGRGLRRLALVTAWLALSAVIALGGAGIVAQMAHPPGTASRAELTWDADRALSPELDGAGSQLVSIGADVDRLGALARTALTEVRAADPKALQETVDEGADATAKIRALSEALRQHLSAMPGDAPDAALRAASGLLGRRSAMLQALEATSGLDARWAELTDRSVAAVTLIGFLTGHDDTVARAAVEGRANRFEAALTILDTAQLDLAEATALRTRLAPNTDVSVLDEWLARNKRYDAALVALYTALRESGGVITATVKAAYREESAARAKLPPDTRGLVVIIAEVARGGLNQAVIAIEEAHARLATALETSGPAGG